MKYPTDPTWVYAYDAVNVPLVKTKKLSPEPRRAPDFTTMISRIPALISLEVGRRKLA